MRIEAVGEVRRVPSVRALAINGVSLVVCSALLSLAPGMSHAATVDRIYFQSFRAGVPAAIYRMDAQGGSLEQVIPAGGQPSVSGDGTWLAIQNTAAGDVGSDIFRVDTAGGSPTNLTNTPGFGPGAFEDSPSIARDTGRIAFSAGGQGGLGEIYAMGPNGQGRIQLTNNSVDDGSPAFSPDGKKVAFYSNRDGVPGLFVMNADGSNQTRLTSDGGWQPNFSPDGQRIAYSVPDSPDSEIFAIGVNGAGKTQLTFDTNYSQPAFSPDGTKIAYQISFPGPVIGSWIGVMDASGANQRELTQPPDDAMPDWGPVEVSDDDGSGQFDELNVRLSGKKKQRLGKAITVKVGCDESCSATGKGKLTASGPKGKVSHVAAAKSKKWKLKKQRKNIAAGDTKALKLRISSKARRGARKALSDRRKVNAKVNVSAIDQVGNRRTAKRTIKLKR